MKSTLKLHLLHLFPFCWFGFLCHNQLQFYFSIAFYAYLILGVFFFFKLTSIATTQTCRFGNTIILTCSNIFHVIWTIAMDFEKNAKTLWNDLIWSFRWVRPSVEERLLKCLEKYPGMAEWKYFSNGKSTNAPINILLFIFIYAYKMCEFECVYENIYEVCHNWMW